MRRHCRNMGWLPNCVSYCYGFGPKGRRGEDISTSAGDIQDASGEGSDQQGLLAEKSESTLYSGFISHVGAHPRTWFPYLLYVVCFLKLLLRSHSHTLWSVP